MRSKKCNPGIRKMFSAIVVAVCLQFTMLSCGTTSDDRSVDSREESGWGELTVRVIDRLDGNASENFPGCDMPLAGLRFTISWDPRCNSDYLTNTFSGKVFTTDEHGFARISNLSYPCDYTVNTLEYSDNRFPNWYIKHPTHPASAFRQHINDSGATFGIDFHDIMVNWGARVGAVPTNACSATTAAAVAATPVSYAYGKFQENRCCDMKRGLTENMCNAVSSTCQQLFCAGTNETRGDSHWLKGEDIANGCCSRNGDCEGTLAKYIEQTVASVPATAVSVPATAVNTPAAVAEPTTVAPATTSQFRYEPITDGSAEYVYRCATTECKGCKDGRVTSENADEGYTFLETQFCRTRPIKGDLI